MDAAIRGGTRWQKDIEGLTTLLIDAEMKMFRGCSTPVIFLQNVVVDLLLGLGFKEHSGSSPITSRAGTTPSPGSSP